MDVLHGLRAAREQRGLTLSDLQPLTGVKADLLAALEEGAFQLLPSGLYGRQVVRAYAKAVGLDAAGVLAALAGHLPEGEDPLDGLARLKGVRRTHAANPPRETGSTIGCESAAPATSRAPCVRWTIDPAFARYALASVLDGVLIGGVSLLLVTLTAAASGLSTGESARLAAPALALLVLLCGGSYFVLLAGVRRSTFGEAVACGRPEESFHKVDAQTAVRRGVACALREGSIVVEWLVARGVGQGIMAHTEDGYRSL